MKHLLILAAFLVTITAAQAQQPNPLTPGVPCYLCVESAPTPRYTPPTPRQNTWQQYVPDYDNSPGPVTRDMPRQSLQGRTPPPVTSGSADMYPTLELQLQADHNAILESQG